MRKLTLRCATSFPESPILTARKSYNTLSQGYPSTKNDEDGESETKFCSQDARSKGEERERVGLQPEVPLARRVQLAVLAHIRHTHTRYDELLKKYGWHTARKTVEPLCLDILVKWRGDEETGRDQLDEILREIFVISDSEDEVDEASSDNASVVEVDPPTNATTSRQPSRQPSAPMSWIALPPRAIPEASGLRAPPTLSVTVDGPSHALNQTRHRGFQRYRRAWDDAIRRRDNLGQSSPPPGHEALLDQPVETGFSSSHNLQPRSSIVSHPSAPNGSAAQGVQMFGQLQANVRRAIVMVGHGEVVPANRELASVEAGQRRRIPPDGHQVQDMLVRSVELPIAPDTPLRAVDQLGDASICPDVHRREGQARFPTQQLRSGEYSPSTRRVKSHHWPHGPVHPGRPWIKGSTPPLGRHDLSFCKSDGRGFPVPAVSLPYAPRGHETDVSSNRPAADRLVVNASWPGVRSNPILMEDRGGFFERVAAPPERAPPPLDAGMSFEVRRPRREILRANPTASQIDPRGLSDGAVPTRFEVAANSRCPIPPSAFQRASGPGRVCPHMWEYEHHGEIEQHRPNAGSYHYYHGSVSEETPSFLPTYQDE